MAPKAAVKCDGGPPSASPPTEGESLVDLYKRWFDIVPATTPELVAESHRLRYQVYCIETGFENADEFPDGLEHDAYDDGRAVCSLLVHRPTASVAGTVRLILPATKESSKESVPALEVSADLAGLGEDILPRPNTGEISRFAISKQFRKRQEDTLIPALYEPTGAPGDARVIPHITLGLMQAILRMSIENGVSDLAIIVEPALDRLIRKLGIHFTPIGPIIEHHGKRRAHYRRIGDLLDDVYCRRREIWEVLTDAGKLWPAPHESS